MKAQSGPKSNLYLSGFSHRFDAFSTTWETLERVIPALLPVWPRAQGSARCRLIDPWKPDVLCRARRAGEGVTEKCCQILPIDPFATGPKTYLKHEDSGADLTFVRSEHYRNSPSSIAATFSRASRKASMSLFANSGLL